MKLTSLLERARRPLLALLGVVTLAASMDASAIPVFARQTGFKCVACHVGGEYPQLTSLGRMFKLTG
ncbi:MAG: cytochrome C, partial [Betaproteobacteria bacterium]|nr:cytochrome C [Betaproteobacteria bacterium]